MGNTVFTYMNKNRRLPLIGQPSIRVNIHLGQTAASTPADDRRNRLQTGSIRGNFQRPHEPPALP